MTAARHIARLLAERADQLAADLLPGGHREGREWRVGSIAGEAGNSLGIRLSGDKRGRWGDFATGEAGDALDLVKATLSLDTIAAIAWSRRWLGIGAAKATKPIRPVSAGANEPDADPERWGHPWQPARPIAGTLAETYLAARDLAFDDPEGRVLRFASRRARLNPQGRLEHHPALLALLCDVRTGEACGIINIYLRQDGTDRLRDGKGKTNTGRAKGAAVMLSDFADVTMGLTICEGPETGIALLMHDLAPVWALGGAGNLANFPVLGGIEALTSAADADEPGRNAATSVAMCWRSAGREAVIIAPPVGDWADPRRPAA
jgi:hypothetical protein